MDIEVYESTTPKLDEELLAVYAAMYADAPYFETPEEVAEFAAEWPRIRSEPGFGLVVARVDGVLVGWRRGTRCARTVDAPVAQAVYAGWGYRPAARVDKSNGKSYDVLCLDRG